MESINYAGGANMTLPADAQIVQGVSGNALYLPAGAGTVPIDGNRNELTISLWRQWDGVVDSEQHRGVFSTANIKAYFDQATDFLTVELAGAKTVTDIKDDQEQTHWCFLFAKNGFFKIYKNAELKAEITTGNYPMDFSEGLRLGGGRTHATFDEFRFYKKVVTEPEIRGLYFLITKGTQVQQLENIIANNTPRYLGVVETVPSTRTAIITKGEKLGAVDANPGDWVLSGKTIGGWKVGVCYKWTGAQWINLEPEVNYAEAYQACLVHMFEIEELKQQTGHFGALFANMLIAQEAFITKLSGDIAFLKKLVVKKLHIDTIEGDEHNDFEAWFDEENGLKINNKGKELFKIDVNGDIFAKNATLIDGFFSGELDTPTLKLLKKEPESVLIKINSGEPAQILFNKVGARQQKRVQGTFKGSKILHITTYKKTKVLVNWEFYSKGGFGSGYWQSVKSEEDYYYAGIQTENGLYSYGNFQRPAPQGYLNANKDVYKYEYWRDKDSYLLKNFDDNFQFIEIGGKKTFMLFNLPTIKPNEANIVWVDENGVLRLTS